MTAIWSAVVIGGPFPRGAAAQGWTVQAPPLDQRSYLEGATGQQLTYTLESQTITDTVAVALFPGATTGTTAVGMRFHPQDTSMAVTSTLALANNSFGIGHYLFNIVSMGILHGTVISGTQLYALKSTNGYSYTPTRVVSGTGYFSSAGGADDTGQCYAGGYDAANTDYDVFLGPACASYSLLRTVDGMTGPLVDSVFGAPRNDMAVLPSGKNCVFTWELVGLDIADGLLDCAPSGPITYFDSGVPLSEGFPEGIAKVVGDTVVYAYQRVNSLNAVVTDLTTVLTLTLGTAPTLTQTEPFFGIGLTSLGTNSARISWVGNDVLLNLDTLGVTTISGYPFSQTAGNSLSIFQSFSNDPGVYALGDGSLLAATFLQAGPALVRAPALDWLGTLVAAILLTLIGSGALVRRQAARR